jgi:beta-aspartyl-peptidase (threonine type)
MNGTVLAVHGGAGAIRRGGLAPDEEAEARRALACRLAEGQRMLAAGTSALAVVERVVAWLEDHELFNAGHGSVLTSEGLVEMGAAIADGRSGTTGAVAGVSRLVHPVAAARLVMERSPHALLVGPAAERFARDLGEDVSDPMSLVTEARRRQLDRVRLTSGGEPVAALPSGVGAVARDRRGHLAAATSTGGVTNQLPGRVGGEALVGAGIWADDATCAVAVTGHGDALVRRAVAREIDALVHQGALSLEGACRAALEEVRARGGRGGCIAVDRAGRCAVALSAAGMFRGVALGGGPARVAIYGDEGGLARITPARRATRRIARTPTTRAA